MKRPRIFVEPIEEPSTLYCSLRQCTRSGTFAICDRVKDPHGPPETRRVLTLCSKHAGELTGALINEVLK